MDSCPATDGPAGVLAWRRLVAVGSLVAGYLIAVWPPWLIGRPGGPHLIFALWLALFLLALLSGGQLMRLREQRAAHWPAAAKTKRVGRPVRSGCGSPGTCMTWWRTTSP